MKKLFFAWALLMASLFCYAAANSYVPDKEKERIKTEVKEVINTLITGCEQVNLDIVCRTYYDSPDFKYIYNGNIFGYKDMVNAMQPIFNILTGQKFTIFNEYYNILDRSTVLYTASCKLIAYFKDGHTVVADPAAAQFILKKIGKEWKIICTVESTVQKYIEKQQAEKLNQVELFKKLVAGIWKCETGKDTLFFFDCKANGNYLEAKAWSTDANGKKFLENKNVIAYDKNSDKFIWTRTFKRGTSWIFACWFSSPSVMEIVSVNYLTNPAGAAFRYRSEYLSPDLIKQTAMLNDKVTSVFNYSRVKDIKDEGLPEGKLNQLELVSQFKGYWRGEVGKDTFELWDSKLTENGMEVNSRTTYKNKILTQEYNVFVYDQSINEFIVRHTPKELFPTFYTLRFTSKDAGEIVPINDISNPDNAQFKILFEFKTPNEYTETILQLNKPALVNTYHLVKKQ